VDSPFQYTVNGLGVGQGLSSGPGPSWELVLRFGLRRAHIPHLLKGLKNINLAKELN
jgi:hypothetical protein